MIPIMEWRTVTWPIASIADPLAAAMMDTYGWFGIRHEAFDATEDEGADDFWIITHVPTGAEGQ